jgi:hypothetical protein
MQDFLIRILYEHNRQETLHMVLEMIAMNKMAYQNKGIIIGEA